MSPITTTQRHAALEFARRTDAILAERGYLPDEVELADILTDCSKFGDIVLCSDCHGSGWGPPVVMQSGGKRHNLCGACLGCGAVGA